MHHFDALAAKAWVEAICHRSSSVETRLALKEMDRLGACGKKRLLQLQGFLGTEHEHESVGDL